ncbi:hypothetical protein CHM_6g5370 [Cryptosporidium hominis]
MDPQFRFNLRPVIQNRNNSGTPKVFIRSTSTGNNVQGISKTPIVPYRQMYGTNFNDLQGVYSMVSPLQSFRTPRLENQNHNNFFPDNKNYLQINTERQIHSSKNFIDDSKILTYRSGSFIQANSQGYKPNETFQSTNYSDNTTVSESQLSSNQFFESENDSFISQSVKPSKNLVNNATNTLDNKSENELKQLIVDPKDLSFTKIENKTHNHIELDLKSPKNISLEEIYETEQFDHFSQLISEVNEKIDVEEIKYNTEDINHNFDKESIISSSDTQGCMEICITPPLSSELITSNNFYFPEDNKEESQNGSILRTNKDFCEEFTDMETHKSDILENQNILSESGKRKFRFSSFCPKLLNCLFPWIRSEQYFEDHDQPIFYIVSNNEESQKLINN